MPKLSNFITLPLRFIEYQFYKVHPLWCTFSITENCNAKCKYCQYWRTKHADLPTESVFKIIRQLKNLGIIKIVYSGGECMMREDLVEIVAYTKKLGIQPSVVSNGLIYNESLFRDLMSHGLQSFSFSLDGSKASIHEAFRKGCPFDQVVHSIQKAVEIKKTNNFATKISTTTVVNKTNISDLENIYHMRKSLGVDRNFFQPIWPIFGEKESFLRFGISDMSYESLRKLAERLMHIPEGNTKTYYKLIPDLYKDFTSITRRYQCFGGRAFVYVDSSGNLFPCSPLSDRQPLGSLLKKDIKDITSKSKLKNRLIEYKHFNCGGCTMTCYMEKNALLSSVYYPIDMWIRRT